MSTASEPRVLVIASGNAGKIREFIALLADLPVRVMPQPRGLEVEETGASFAANARIKARAVARATGQWALADDSGLAVAALGGAPGVYTADWAETPTGRDFGMAMERLWRELEAAGAPEPRTAQFRCTLVLALPNGDDQVFEGMMPGRIVWPMRGTQGHGYDPVFQPEGHEVTFGEMDRWVKNRISHRADAFRKFVEACFT